MKTVLIDGIEYKLVPVAEDKYETINEMFEEFDERLDDIRFEMQCLIDKAEEYNGYDLSDEMRDALCRLIE